MRGPQLQQSLILLLILISSSSAVPVKAQDGYWVAVGVDYFTNRETLANNSAWVFNASRGSNDRWGINYTISGFGFHPTTVIVCDEDAYRNWIDTGATDQCHFLWHVNYSLHISLDIPHPSQWYLILNNTNSVTLYFSLQLTHYQWKNPSTTPSFNFFEDFNNLIVYLIFIGIIVFVLIPCICRFNCFGFFRRRSRVLSSKKEANSQTVILVLTPEQLVQYIEEDDN